MAFGFGFGMPRSFATPFSPASLFATGAPGAWYDPSDRATLFQNSAGTTPVTAVEQPVGLMLDKSQGLVLGPELGSSRNIVANWTAYGTNTVVQDGDAVKVTYVDNANGAYVFLVGAGITTGKRYKVTFEAKTNTGNTVTLKASDGSTDVISAPLTDSYQTFTYYPNYLAGSMIAGLTNGSLGAGEVYWVRNISVRELPGNHAFQSTAASRPVLSARYNLLTKTEEFNDAAWAKNAVTVTSNAAVAPDGTTTADLIYPSSSGTLRAVYNNAAIVSSAGISYVSKFYVKRSGFRWVAIDGFNTSYAAYFDLLNGVVGTVLSGHTATITTAGDDWYLCSVTTTTSNGSAGYTAARPVDANGSQTATTSGINGLYIWGADLRVANNGTTQPAYQRVNTATDYATTGFLPYLKFDGVDDSLSTNSINFTSTDKMSVFAGMRKLSDAADGVLVDNFVVGQNGNFQVLAPYAGVSKYSLYSKGTLQAGAETNSSAYAAPITNVLTGISDISGDRATLRLNSAQVASNTADQGTGNYGNYPLYIGRRSGTSLPFNGQLYSMIIVGKAVTAGELSSSETYVNQKTGAY